MVGNGAEKTQKSNVGIGDGWGKVRDSEVRLGWVLQVGDAGARQVGCARSGTGVTVMPLMDIQ